MRNKLILLLLFYLFTGGVPAQEIIYLKKNDEPVRISRQFLYLDEKTNSVPFPEVLNHKGFSPTDQDFPNFNLTRSRIWGKARFTTNEYHSWILWLEPAAFEYLDLYQKRGDGEWTRSSSGFRTELDKREIRNHHMLFSLDVVPGDTTIVAFSVHQSFPIMFDIKVAAAETLIDSLAGSDIYYNICFGIILMMLIYNLYLYLTHKAKIYLYYVLYVTFCLLFSLNLSGFLIYFPSFFRQLLFISPPLVPILFGLFGVLFTKELFRELISGVFGKIINIFFLCGGITVIMGASGYAMEAEGVLQVLGIFYSAICITAGVRAVRKKHSAAFFYLTGFGIYTLSIVYIVLGSQNIIPPGSFMFKSIVTGSVIESIMLSFALGDKLKYFQREKDKAKEEALHQERENARLISEQNKILEEKVKERTAELEEKNKEVMDSIHYARRIQNTLLAQENLLRDFIPEHFILFKPKDIVSGDFYWATQKENRLYVAVCDSTGHGVPGAFMSLLNISFLNEAITEKNIVQPNEIFNYVRQRLIDNISKDGQKDGMDGVLLCLDKASGEISYSAANCTPVLFKNEEIVELKSDKMPVGEGVRTESFSLFSLQERDGLLYLFTDGYADQFGGPQGKKFKYKRLYESLSGISRVPLKQQKELLNSHFETWKGSLEQIDDVCVVGIRI